jgi:uncharacterized protein
MDNPFDCQNYINIETYKKSGQTVQTPVWFVMENGLIYIRTGANSAKVKRISKNPNINIAPCKVNGILIGQWVKASAQIIGDQLLAAHINKLFNKKYGIQKFLFDITGWFSRLATVTLVIKVNSEPPLQ